MMMKFAGSIFALAFASLSYASPMDAALVGQWTAGDKLFSDSMTVTDDGKLSEVFSMDGNALLDYIATTEIDSSVTPHRAKLTVSQVNYVDPDLEITLNVGDQGFCIYDINADTLTWECGETDFPSEFSKDATIFMK